MPEDKYRILITVTKHDSAGKVLRRMAAGQVVVWEGLEDARQAADGFLEIARVVLEGLGHPDRKFTAYGAILIQDETTGKLVSARPLQHGAE